MDPLLALQNAIGYSFNDRRLLERALVHASADGVLEEDVLIAGRLSWLGDATLHMIVSDKLFHAHSDATKEELHKMREKLTDNTTLGRVGFKLGLEEAARIGASLSTNLAASDKHVMIAGILEAVLAAVYQDGGIANARSVVLRILQKDVEHIPKSADETF